MTEATEEKNVHGVKLDPSKSRFAKNKQERMESKSFQELAEQAHEDHEGNKAQAIELGRKFIEILEDKTLQKNKGPSQKRMERNVIGRFIDYIIRVNNDTREKFDGMGSSSGIILLMNCILKMRDRINQLEYQLEQTNDKMTSSEAGKEDVKEE